MSTENVDTVDVAATQPLEPEEEYSTALQNHPFTIAWRKASYWWSMALTIFSCVVVIYGIAKQWTNPPWDTENTHPVVEIVLFVAMLIWISFLEGCQISIVGLQGINVEAYKDQYPRAYEVCKLAHKGPNVERFLVGRQFLLLFNGFLASRVGGGDYEDFHMGSWHWNEEVTQFLWLNSVLLMIVIIVPGQLVTQLIAADKMMGFLDLRIVASYWTVLMPCMFVESIGLTHMTYILKDFLRWAASIDPNEGDPAKKMNKNFLYYARVLLSCAAVIFSTVFIAKGLAMSQTNATTGAGWSKLPGYAAVLVSCFLLFIIASAEGLQVSAIALATVRTSSFKKKSPLAYKTCQILYAGRNMQAFLVGRQFMVAMMIVLLGRVTSYSGSDGIIEGDDWGMGKGFNEGLLQTGFLGAILVVNVGQLASQVTASIFPIAFINNRIMGWLLQVMLIIEFSGVVNACWPLARGLDAALGMKKDPFEHDENADSLQNNIIDRKKSLGIPVAKGVSPFDLNQPEQEYHVEYTYKVSYI